MISEPVLTLSPVETFSSLTVPANGAGTSIDALSPSTTISDCSASTLSPTFTSTSVTSTSSPPISGTFTSFAPAVAAGAEVASSFSSGFGAAAGAAPSASKTMISEPVLTFAPVSILISFTVPANGAGTSIEALSPSTTISDCSASILSPTFTRISVTSTSSPPISGTLTSLAAVEAAAGAGAASAFFSSAAGAASAAAPSASKIIIREPVSTLSPVAILISFTTPACGEGTSIEALSPSTVISDCSASTLSPTFTRISVTSTSSDPISGTLISVAITLLPLKPDAG